MGSRSRNKLIVSILKNLLAWSAALMILVPVALIILTAFKGSSESLTMSLGLPKEWNWSNFATVIEKGKLVRSFLNSLLYAGCSTLLTVFLASMAAYVFSRRRSKGMGAIYMYIVLGMVNDKDVNTVLSMLPKDAVYYFTQASVKRAMPVEEFAQKAEKHDLHGNSYANVELAYRAAKQNAEKNDLIFVGGSTFIVADMLNNIL